MTARLRVVLDQLVSPVCEDLATASRGLARALVATAPSGCDVAAIAPGVPDLAAALEAAVPGLADITPTRPRREIAASWQVGVAPGIGGGMIHSPTLLAPLVRHDRTHDGDQTVVTLWDLDPWEYPDEVGRSRVAWHKAMLRRAVKHADAVIVPGHAAAVALAEIAPLGDRIRVISGAPPTGFGVPSDDVGRRRELSLPEGYLLLHGSRAASARLDVGLRGIAAAGGDLPVVVASVPTGEEPGVLEQAEACGIPAHRMHVLGTMDAVTRGALLGGAVAMIEPSVRTAFPWRVLEALAVGVPIIAADTPSHRGVLADAGAFFEGTDAAALAAALGEVLATTASAQRFAVLAADRGRAFHWQGTAERVWQLHAEL